MTHCDLTIIYVSVDLLDVTWQFLIDLEFSSGTAWCNELETSYKSCLKLFLIFFFCFFKSTKVTHSIWQKPFANNVSIFKVGVFISVGVFGGCSITCVNESLFIYFLNNEWFLLKVSINKNWQFGNGHYVMERQIYKGGYTNEL